MLLAGREIFFVLDHPTTLKLPMKLLRKLLTLVVALLALAASRPAHAERIFGVDSDNKLFTFDSA
jgi:hypothetical protein